MGLFLFFLLGQGIGKGEKRIWILRKIILQLWIQPIALLRKDYRLTLCICDLGIYLKLMLNFNKSQLKS